MEPLISIIIPVLEDTDAADRLLAGISPDPRLELIVVDGGGDPRLADLIADRRDIALVRSARGRAVQMNAGAARARGEWLLFLHADSTLPRGWVDIFERSTAGASAGWFRFALDDSAWQARAIERGVRWRVRLLSMPYGDQGLFVTRRLFSALGGYREELPLMEDVDFVRRFVRAATVVEMPVPLVTSSRRWRRDGWLRRSARNLALLTLYLAGVPPRRLAEWYRSG